MTDAVTALQEATRQGWQQLERIDHWLKTHTPDARDADIAAATLYVLEDQRVELHRLTRERATLRRQLASLKRYVNQLLAEKRTTAVDVPADFNFDACVAELRQFEADGGKLPCSPVLCAEFERSGFIIDFESGQLFPLAEFEAGTIWGLGAQSQPR